MAPQRGLLKSLLVLSPVLILAPLYAFRAHYALPAPMNTPTHPTTGAPHVSEAGVLAVAKYLSEDIGYRTVGTAEHAAGDAWLLAQAEALRAQCEHAVAQSAGRKLECEVWRQQGSGSHRFDMMGKRLYKNYVDLTNIIVRVSDGTPEGKEHAVLVNSHLDSTLPSPGAADDAISVGVMLECLRVFIETPDWSPKHAIVFLFNNAEESLQDGSHLYSTQHVTAPTIRAAINLEAAGSTGRELLFQATSEQMIEAYSKVPRPMGTIVAADVFKTGIMLSDTDFRQFVEYLDVTGLDMAVVGNSYLYHMRKDLVENIQPGTAQHMAENAFALLGYLSSEASPLPSLVTGYSNPTTVYFSYLDWHFFMYSASTALLMYSGLLLASFVLVWATFVDPAPALRRKEGLLRELARGMRAVVVGVLGALVGANVVAIVMEHVLGRGMSWFAYEYSCLGLFGPAALTGALLSQMLIRPVRERALLNALLVLQSLAALVLQAVGVGSAAMLALSAGPLFGALALDAVIASNDGNPTLLAYGLGQIMPLLTGAQLAGITLDVFVPLTGRIGAEAPSEHIVATIVAGVGAYTFPLALPFVHRAGRRTLVRAALVCAGATVLAMAVFARRSPFDAMHQRRLFVLHMENTTSLEQHLHVAAADRAPGFDALVHELAAEFGAAGVRPQPIVMDDWNPDWDVIYPVSAFLTPRKVDLKVEDESAAMLVSGDRITIKALNDIVDPVARTRSLTLRIEHPNVIWTAIAFDAHVLKWSLDNNPPAENARHHIKEASFHGVDAWSLDLVLAFTDGGKPPTLRVNHVGIRESAMWPGKRREKAKGGRAMEVFEVVDTWLEERTGGTVDAMMVGCVGGVTVV